MKKIRIICDHCGRPIECYEWVVGKKIACPLCAAQITVLSEAPQTVQTGSPGQNKEHLTVKPPQTQSCRPPQVQAETNNKPTGLTEAQGVHELAPPLPSESDKAVLSGQTPLKFDAEAPGLSLHRQVSTSSSLQPSLEKDFGGRAGKASSLSSTHVTTELLPQNSLALPSSKRLIRLMLATNLMLAALALLAAYLFYPQGRKLASQSPQVQRSLDDRARDELQTLLQYSDRDLHKAIQTATMFLLAAATNLNQANSLVTGHLSSNQYVQIQTIKEIFNLSPTNKPISVGVPTVISTQQLLIRFVAEKRPEAGYLEVMIKPTEGLWKVTSVRICYYTPKGAITNLLAFDNIYQAENLATTNPTAGNNE